MANTTERRLPNGKDVLAGVTTAVANVPDSMANATLAGVSPLTGLYGLMVGTPVAALTTSSQFLTVAITAAMALAVRDALASLPAAEQAGALGALALVVGLLQIIAGALRTGTFLRFVSNAVMRGFLTGVSVSIVLSQIPQFTGASSRVSSKLLAAVDILAHPGRMQLATVLAGGITLALIVALQRTRIEKFAILIAIAVVTAAVAFLSADVTTVGDIAAISGGLPRIELPSIGTLLALLVPAVSVALIGVIQGAGVSKSTPNPDGRYPDVSRDFVGQGLGNLASGAIGGMPVGGSVSSTALNIQAGATSRWSNFIIGPVILGVVLIAAPAVELVPMTCLAAALIVVGFKSIDVGAIGAVWSTNIPARAIMVITFVSTLFVPIQFAVLIGVILSVMQYVYSASLDVNVMQLEIADDGSIREQPPSERATDYSVTALDIYGSVFYAGTEAIEDSLPDAIGSKRAVVILRMRGRTDVGSTFLGLLRRYADELHAGGGKLMLAGVSPQLLEQLERTYTVDTIGVENIYRATPVVGASMKKAHRDAQKWLDATDIEERRPRDAADE